ncbi:MAG: serine O-acetyltransferase [Anaerolineales bacterium]|nr:serine O-acetyltransferase [Anaerolineales bacterium]
MKFREFLYLLRSDFHRHMGKPNPLKILRYFLVIPGVKYSFYMRLCRYLREKPLKAFGMFFAARVLLFHYAIKFGISIPDTTQIGSGFYIGHFGGVVVNSSSVIGRNCNISHGVTIGQLNRGARAGCPVIGDNVFIGPGAKILGKVKVGDYAAIGANCVVVDDVPPHSVVIGVPAKLISGAGSEGYINNTDY